MTSVEDLAARARSLVQEGRRAILGITGSPGAGKSTLAEVLTQVLRQAPPPGMPAGEWVAYVPMDGFHLADVELERLGRRDRKGAPDTFDAAGYASLLQRIRQDAEEVVYAPAFERVLEQPIAGSIPTPQAARLVITEGNYLLLEVADWARVRAQLDEVWHCDVERDEQVRRLVARHERFGKPHDAALAWVLNVDLRNADIVDAVKARADLLLPHTALTELEWSKVRSTQPPPRALSTT